ncbi:MAG: hypothetical protein AB1898_28950 [Acidobacteriota bacterium]
MTQWIKKLHLYTGLLNLTVLAIFAIIGIASTFPTRKNSQSPSSERFVDFDVPGGLDDRRLADYIQEALALPLTRPAPPWQLGRDDDNRLWFGLPTPSCTYHITVFDQEDRLRIEKVQFPLWQYLFHLHEITPRGQPHLAIRMWAYYMEFAIWSLIWMALSGVYLWLTSRRKVPWARASFAAGILTFVAFYLVVR